MFQGIWAKRKKKYRELTLENKSRERATGTQGYIDVCHPRDYMLGDPASILDSIHNYLFVCFPWQSKVKHAWNHSAAE